MAAKEFSDVRPNRGDKNSSKEGIKSTGKTKPVSDSLRLRSRLLAYRLVPLRARAGRACQR